MRQPATLSDGPRASAPVPTTIQPGVPEPASHRPSAPDSLNLAEPNAEPPFSSTPADMQKAVLNMQQLQSNLMRPAARPSARFQAPAADQADLQGGIPANHSLLLEYPPADLVCPQVSCSGFLLFISSSLLELLLTDICRLSVSHNLSQCLDIADLIGFADVQ